MPARGQAPSPPRSRMVRAVAFWQCIASAVTMCPSRASSASSSGRASISLLSPATSRWPSTSRCSTAQALTRWSGRPALAIEAAPGGLAVDGDDRTAPDLPGKRGDEAAEAGLECVRVEQPEDPRERVVARNAALQAQKTPQQRLLGASEQGHVDASFGAAQGRRQRDQQDLQQIVALGAAAWARVDQITKARSKPFHAAVLQKQGGSTSSTCPIKRIYKFLMRFPWPGALRLP